MPTPLVVTYLDTTAQTGTSATPVTSVTLNAPATVAADDILIAVVRLQAGTTQALTTPTGWTEIGAAAGATSFSPIDFHFLWKRATASEPTTYTFTYASSARATGFIHRFSGVVATGSPWAGSSTAYSHAATIPALSHTASAAGTEVWLYAALNSDITITPPAGFTKRSTLSPSGASSATVADRPVQVGTVNTGTGTASTSDAQVTFSGTLVPAHANVAPTADAGPDVYAEANDEVFLVGSATDPEGIKSISWTQTGGPAVQVYGVGQNVSFYAPTALAGTDVTFQLTVTDASLATATDTKVVHVAPPSLRLLTGTTWQAVPMLLHGVEHLNVPSAKVATLTQTFDDLVGFTSTGAGIAVTGGQLVIQAVPGYPAVSSNARYDLTSSAVYAQLVTAPNVGNGSVQTFLTLFDSTGNKIDIGVSGGSLICNQQSGGVTDGFTTAYTPGASGLWLRISHDGANLVWDTSPDAVTWTTKRTSAPTIALTRLQVVFTAGTFNAEPTPGAAVWENLNSLPVTGGTVRVAADLEAMPLANPIPIANMRTFTGAPSTYAGTGTVANTSLVSTDGHTGATVHVVQQNFPAVVSGSTSNYAMPPTGTGIAMTSIPLLGGPAYEARISYYFRAKSAGVPWGWGAKLPGLGGVGQGRTSVPTGGQPSVYGWSARCMERRQGSDTANLSARLVGYFYAPWQQAGAIGVDLATGSFLVANQWHHLEQYHRMNSVTTEGATNPPANGIHRIWLDGVLVYEATNVVYRFYTDAKITHFCYDNFYGGSDVADAPNTWGPTSNTVHQFSDLVITAGPGSGS